MVHRGGAREGSGRPKKRLRMQKPKKPGRPTTLAGLTQGKARSIIGDDGLLLVKARAGQLVTRDRCMEVLRATRTAIAELYDEADTSLWKKAHAIVKVVRERCNCGHGIASRALQALKDCTAAAIEEFMLNEITKRVTDRRHLRKLQPGLLAHLEKAIQLELMHRINPNSVGVSVDAVRELIRNVSDGDVDVSCRTAWKALASWLRLL